MVTHLIFTNSNPFPEYAILLLLLHLYYYYLTTKVNSFISYERTNKSAM